MEEQEEKRSQNHLVEVKQNGADITRNRSVLLFRSSISFSPFPFFPPFSSILSSSFSDLSFIPFAFTSFSIFHFVLFVHLLLQGFVGV